jgi:hypothetical protein
MGFTDDGEVGHPIGKEGGHGAPLLYGKGKKQVIALLHHSQFSPRQAF